MWTSRHTLPAGAGAGAGAGCWLPPSQAYSQQAAGNGAGAGVRQPATAAYWGGNSGRLDKPNPPTLGDISDLNQHKVNELRILASLRRLIKAARGDDPAVSASAALTRLREVVMRRFPLTETGLAGMAKYFANYQGDNYSQLPKDLHKVIMHTTEVPEWARGARLIAPLGDSGEKVMATSAIPSQYLAAPLNGTLGSTTRDPATTNMLIVKNGTVGSMLASVPGTATDMATGAFTGYFMGNSAMLEPLCSVSGSGSKGPAAFVYKQNLLLEVMFPAIVMVARAYNGYLGVLKDQGHVKEVPSVMDILSTGGDSDIYPQAVAYYALSHLNDADLDSILGL